jgi:hypothetical protein
MRSWESVPATPAQPGGATTHYAPQPGAGTPWDQTVDIRLDVVSAASSSEADIAARSPGRQDLTHCGHAWDVVRSAPDFCAKCRVKCGARSRHGRYVIFQLAEVAVPHPVRRDPAPDRPAQAEAAPHMTAWCSTPGSAQERSARRALVKQPRRLGWHICRGRDVALGVWHRPSMPRCLAAGEQGVHNGRD